MDNNMTTTPLEPIRFKVTHQGETRRGRCDPTSLHSTVLQLFGLGAATLRYADSDGDQIVLRPIAAELCEAALAASETGGLLRLSLTAVDQQAAEEEFDHGAVAAKFLEAQGRKMPGRKVFLQDCNEKTYEVEYEVAVMCETIKALMPGSPDEEDEEEDFSTTPIQLPEVEAQHLELILEWCKHELENKDAKEDLKRKWNQEFFDDKDDTTIFAIILGANYLDCKELQKAGVYHVAGILHKLTPKQIWERYNPDKPLPSKEEIDKIFEDPQLEWAAMPDFTWE